MTDEALTPGKILELSGYYWKTCTLHAGVKLDLFTYIHDKEKSVEEIAGQTGTDSRALTFLLNALCAMELLEKRESKYSNTPSSRTFLCKDSIRYIGHMILHHHYLADSWIRLDHAVKTGKPIRTRSSFGDEERRESFLMGMFNNAMGIAPNLMHQIDLTSRRRLLDLGGGPGTYAVHFCMKNPNLNATVYDLPTSKPFAEKIIERFQMQSRIRFHGGDYLIDPIPGTYDVAWLSHILHSEGPSGCRNILKNCVSALEPGGMVILHDFILEESMDAPLFPALFSLNMLLGTESGQSYSEKQLTQMLSEAGVVHIQRHPFRGPTESGILIGYIP
ncbi:MAG: methyltransferase [Thermodesulfobacteriota bacterium]